MMGQEAPSWMVGRGERARKWTDYVVTGRVRPTVEINTLDVPE